MLFATANTEKRFELFRSLVRTEPVDHGKPVIKPLVGAKVIQAADASGLGVFGPVDEPVDACVDQGAGAHGAGLECDNERAVIQSPSAEFLSSSADGDDLGVGGGVVVRLAEVVALAEDDRFVVDQLVDHGSHGHLALRGGLVGQVQGAVHHGQVVGDRRVLHGHAW